MFKTILAGIAALIITVGGLFIGADFVLTETMDISLIGTIANVSMLTQPADTDQIIDYPFDKSEDMVDVQETVNDSVENMITYSEEYGYNVNFSNLPDNMKNIIVLTDKQVGALAETVIEQEAQGQIHVKNDMYMDVELYQVKFTEGEAEGQTIVNAVVGVDATSYKESIGAPEALAGVVDLIPDTLYVSSTFVVTKGQEAFTYSLEHVELEINNLNAEQSKDTFHVVDTVLGLGSAEHVNLQIADALMGALIGSEDTRGLAYSLKDIGANDFNFIEQDGQVCFAVER